MTGADRNRGAAEKLLSMSEVVVIDGCEFHLSVPGAEELRNIRREYAGMAALAAEDTDEVAERAGMVDRMMDLNVLAVSGALGVCESVAIRLIAADGGDEGALCRAAQELCGIRPPDGAEELDPNA